MGQLDRHSGGVRKEDVSGNRHPPRTTLLFGMFSASASCGTSEPLYLAYRAAFHKAVSVDVERHLREVASRWELVVHEHSKSLIGVPEEGVPDTRDFDPTCCGAEVAQAVADRPENPTGLR